MSLPCLALRDSLVLQADYAAAVDLHKRLCWITEGQRRRLVWLDDLNQKQVTANDPVWNAELAIIGVIKPDDCWFTISNASRSPLNATQLSCRLSPPLNPTLSADFTRALANLNAIMAAACTPHYDALHGSDRLTLRHVPFVVRREISPSPADSRPADTQTMVRQSRRHPFHLEYRQNFW